MNELNQLSVIELKELAKQKGLKLSSKMTKAEIVDALLENMNSKDDEAVANKNIIKTPEESEVIPNNKEDFVVEGVLEVLPDGYGFLRGENYLSTPKDIYVSP